MSEINKFIINKKTKRKKIKENLNPINIQFLNDLTKDSFCITFLDNTFIVFKSINNILYLIYSNENKSIISYNLINNKIINEIKNAHERYIANFRYYLDNYNKRDLILSISSVNNNIKLWNINNYECLINIKNINKEGCLFSACFLNNNNLIYIITSNGYNFGICNFESIKIYDLKGNKIKKINDSNDNTFFIDTYYDYKSSKTYILTGNKGYVKSYDYNQNKIYHKYYDNDIYVHLSIIINNKKEIVELIESCYDGNIRIWNFHTGELLNKIKINNNYLYGICLWNNKYLFVGCSDKSFKLINLKKGIIIKELNGHNNYVKTIKKIIIPKYGECLISQGMYYIKLWINKNK